MNIVILCYPTFGGSGVVATELGMSLAKKGHHVHFVTYSTPVRLGHFIQNVSFHEVHLEEYPLFHYQPYEMALATKLVDVVKKYNIEVVHAHYAIPHAYAAFMAKQILEDEGIKISIVTTLHGTDITLVGNHPYYKAAVNFSINASDVVTSVSDSLRKDTYRLFDIKKDKEILVIPNFIDMSIYENSHSSPCKRHMIAGKDDFIITHISNFRKVKRIEDVVEVFYKLRKQIGCKLVMVGDGPEREPAEQRCQELGISEDVIFLGNYLNINEILCFCDLFLLPSEMESFGLSALEAMAMGVPVVSSNSGGLSEVNEYGFSGYLNDIGDVDGMVESSLKILGDREVLQRFKRQAKERSRIFDQEKIIPMYEEIYYKVIGRK